MSKRKDFIRKIEADRKIRNRITFFLLMGLGIGLLLFFNIANRTFTKNFSDIQDNLNYFLIMNLNIVLLVILGMLVLRYLIKLVYERKTRILGYKIKNKLALAFIAISTSPLVIFLIFVRGYINDNLNFWFKGQYTRVIEQSIPVVEDYHAHLQSQIRFYGQKISEKVDRKELSQSSFEAALESFGADYPIDGVVLYGRDFSLRKRIFANEPAEDYWNDLDKLKAYEGKPESTDYRGFHQALGDRFVYRTLFHLPNRDLFLEIFKVSEVVSVAYLNQSKTVIEDFRDLFNYRELIRENYSLYLLIIAFCMIFICIWFGYYLANSITRPVQNLLDGTHKLSAGDLDFEVENTSNDEMATLINAFNKMLLELKQNRNQLDSNRIRMEETNQELEASNILFTTVLENIRSGVMFFDNLGFILGINSAMIHLLNIRQEDCQGQNYRNLVDKEALAVLTQLEERLIKGKQNSWTEDSYLALDNSVLHLNFQIIHLSNAEKESLGILVVANDLTYIDRSTRAKAWKEVAKRIAHEIKNPLTPIKLSSERIKRNIDDSHPEKEKILASINTIIKQVDSMKLMVNEFSRFAKLPDVNLDYRELNPIVEEIHEFFKLSLSSNIRIHTLLDPKIPKLLLDYEQTKQILRNLVQNSIASIGDKEGEIEIRTELDTKYQRVLIHVTDNGKGIKSEILDRVFEPYVTTKKDGTGLGLAIVDKIVSDMNGFIKVESIPNLRTVFTIQLPTC